MIWSRFLFLALLLPTPLRAEFKQSLWTRVRACLTSLASPETPTVFLHATQVVDPAVLNYLTSLSQKQDRVSGTEYDKLHSFLESHRFDREEVEKIVVTLLRIATVPENLVFKAFLRYQLNLVESPVITATLSKLPRFSNARKDWEEAQKHQKEFRESGNYELSGGNYFSLLQESDAELVERLTDFANGVTRKQVLNRKHLDGLPELMIDRAKRGLLYMTWSELETLLISGHGINNPGGHLANAAIELASIGEYNPSLALGRLNLILKYGGTIEWTRRMKGVFFGLPDSLLKRRILPLMPVPQEESQPERAP